MTAILVLGMHRSGTSAVTRVFNILGFKAPETMIGINTSNKTGHWESQKLARLNDAVLAALDLTWDNFNATRLDRLTSAQRREFTQDIAGLIAAEFTDHETIVIKDPRICRLVPLYFEALSQLGYAVHCVLPVRNPLEVAQSLKARNNMEPPEGGLLWLRYVLEAWEASQSSKAAYVGFDALLSDWRPQMEGVLKSMSVQTPYALDDVASQISNYLDRDQKHQTKSVEELIHTPYMRGWVSDAFSALTVLSQNPKSKKAHSDLARIKSAFDQSVGGILGVVQSVRADHMSQKTLAEAQATELGQRDAAIADFKEKVARREREIVKLSSELTLRDEDRARRNQDIIERDALLAERKQEISERDKEISNRDKIISDHDAIIAELRATLKSSEATLRSMERERAKLSEESRATRKTNRRLQNDKWNLQDGLSVAREHIKALEASTSWRLTAPIRGVKKLFQTQAITTQTPLRLEAPQPGPAAPKAIQTDAPRQVSLQSYESPNVFSKQPDLAANTGTSNEPATPAAQANAKKSIARVEKSGVFDAVFYVSQYPDVQSSSLTPVQHYVLEGWRSGYSPSASFNTQAYLSAHPEIQGLDICPLVHYLDHYKPDVVSHVACGRIAVFMAVSGPYDELKEPTTLSENADYFVFTDQPVNPNSVWQKRPFDYFISEPTRTARFIKTHPHLYFSDYDWAVWVDANLQINCRPEDLIAPHMGQNDIATWHHPLRDCVYEEAKECIKRSKDKNELITQQINRYKAGGFPKQAGLFETSVFVSKMGEPRVVDMMNAWWAEIETGSRRDQLGLPKVLRGSDVRVGHLAPLKICMRSDPRFNYFRHISQL